MTLSVNWATKVVYSDASITDLPAHHLELRDLEASVTGMLYDDICSWQNLNLGGGASLPQIDYINGYVLEFIGAGPFQINGNLNCTINDTGVQVERKTSAAYATTAVGGSGPSAESIAAAVISALNATTGPRTVGEHLQIQTAVLAGEEAGAGTGHVTFTDGPAVVGADVPMPGEVGNRTNVTISV